jgi:hypothetical protein
MNDCQQYHDLIASYAAGEIGPSDLEDLLAHCSACEDCRGMVELHRSFATTVTGLPEPSEELFEAMRGRVLDQLELNQTPLGAPGRERRSVVQAGTPFWSTLADWFGAHPVPAPALVILLLLAAGFAGRWTAAPGWSDKSLLRAVQEQAGRSTGLDAFWDATFTFANVAVRQTEAGDLSLGFDVCRHVEADTPRHSPLASEVLLSTILDSPTLGERIKAMKIAPDLQDARLQEALIYTLHNDPNLAVRLQALGVLSRGPLDAATQDALLRTLRDDTSVQARLLALDALAAHHVDPEAIRRAVSEAGQASDDVIMQRVLEIAGQS